MESKPVKESVVSRLFGFGRKPEPEPAPEQAPASEASESGFARPKPN